MNSSIPCRLCGAESIEQFFATVLVRHTVRFYQCLRCELLESEDPWWLEEAYASPLAVLDTGIMKRNLVVARTLKPLLFFLCGNQQFFVDFAGGYGILTRLMRDAGFDFFWSDPHAQNLCARGFEYVADKGSPAAVTACECFEHFINPRESLQQLLSLSKTIFLTTDLLPDPLPAPDQWGYYTFRTGQHIAFYRLKTLNYIADKYGLQVYSSGSIHLLTDRTLIPVVAAILLGERRFKWVQSLLGVIAKQFLQSKFASDMDIVQDKYKDM